MTPSEYRLHPLSFLFVLGRHLRTLLLPGLLLLLTARTSSWGGWEYWAMLGIIPVAFVAFYQYLTLRYRYAAGEMVIRSGLVFRNERHIPYERIQNIDAVQNLLHRAVGVAEVRVETGAGTTPEATLRVLPFTAFEEMRRRVFEEKRRAAETVREDSPAAAPVNRSVGSSPAVSESGAPLPDSGQPRPEEARPLLRLTLREQLLAGLIENRGMVVVGATFGLVWEAGLLDTLSNRIFGGSLSGRGVFRSIAGAVFGQGSLSAGKVALTVGAFAAFLLLVRLVSMAWAMARLHGFTLSHRGADLRSDFGLFTRYAATIPIGRIQTLTIHEGPLHRLFGRASVRVDTAGGPGGGEDGGAKREWLAPIIRSDALPGFLHDVLPDVTLSAIQWRPPHPRAFARKLKINALLASVVSLSVVAILGVWDLLLLAILLAWAALHARQHVARLAHAIAGGAVLFRSGWIWRRTTIARFAKMQALAIHESPSDRHSRMASVRVDTAGAGDHSHRVHIPYLDITDAKALFASLSVQAARTEFRW